jgi:hypothetical protein
VELSDLVLPDITLVPKIITATVEGVLEESDLRELLMGQGGEEQAAEGKASKTPAPEFLPVEEPTDLKRLRERHHSVARLVAKGMQQSLVASITGYTQSYLSVLLNAPAMRELVEMYRIQNGSAAEVIGERLKTVGLKAIDKIEDKLEAEDLSAFELATIAKLGLDRSGHGPSSTQHTIQETHLVDHAELARLNKAALQRSAEVIVPMSEVRKALPSPTDDQAASTAKEGLGDAGA